MALSLPQSGSFSRLPQQALFFYARLPTSRRDGQRNVTKVHHAIASAALCPV